MSSISPSTDQRCSFISLPPSIRHLIYSYAGLPLNHFLYLDYENWTSLPPPGRDTTSNILNLLLICRLIYTEASSLLYSTNTVITHNLEPLLNFTKSSLSSITSLKIHLNASAATNHCSYRYAYYNLGSLNSLEPVIHEWETAINRIAPHIEPNKLELWLICDCEPGRVDLAKLVLAPLRQLPMLRHCHIRLGCEPNHSLRQLAQDAAEQAIGILPVDSTPPRPVFPFLRLPSELRLKILEYTDLVAPLNRVVWHPNRGYSVTKKCGACRYGPPYCHPNDHEACALGKVTSSCKICPHSRKSGGCSRCCHYACQFYHCEQRATRSDQIETGCFCASRHAAYSRLCRCWAPPAALFLVSRSFLKDVQALFFTCNLFTIHNPEFSRVRDPVQGVPPQLEAYPGSAFLNTLPTEALRYLNNLQTLCEPSLEGQSRSPLRHTIDDIRENLNLQYLCVFIRPAYLSETIATPTVEKDIDSVRDLVNKLLPLGHRGLMSIARKFVVRIDDRNTSLTYYYYARPLSEELPRVIRGQMARHTFQASRLLNKASLNEVESPDSSGMHEDLLVEGFWCT
ncbi:hypothetical protein F5Y05DRAFT_415841 [Hypoxylon sp. FL0543]|nr:hypothetical protein F5Y05DRAFT_415841 [Hypoxylon sp. FL0543]